MSSRQKTLIFSLGGALSLGCVLTVAVAVALPRWVHSTVLCQTGAELVNASGPELDKFLGRVGYGLFHGERVKQCGLGGRPLRFNFFPDLLPAVPAGLHVTVVFFCGVLMLFSSVATGFFFFNAFGKPYETLQGPMGLYLWNFICCVCSSLVMVLFAVEVKLLHLSRRIANFNEASFVFQTHGERYELSYFLLLLVLLLHATSFLLVRLAGTHFPFREGKQTNVAMGAADLMY